MELWVRNQTRDLLIEVSSVSVEEVGPSYGVIYRNGLVASVLGTYDTKERCIEIIDEIQKLLMQGDPKNWFVHINNCEMPTDEAIELLRQIKEVGSVVTKGGADCEVIMPSVLVYEMPKE